MNAAKKSFLLVYMSAAMLASFLILVKAFDGDSTLRIVLAAGGFVVFVGMYVALLVASKRTPAS